MRRLLLWLHRWFGIVLAVYVIVIGVSGSALVFHDEIAATFRVPRVEPTAAARLDADQVVARLRGAFPGWQLQTLYWPEHEHAPWFAEVRQGPVGVLGEIARGVYLHPGSGEVLLVHDYSSSPWRWLQLLHFNLVSGRTGRLVNGWLSVATIFSVLTGILLWWPKERSGRRLWTVNRSARPKRFIWELHQVTGAYLMLFVLTLCVTGSYFAWRASFHQAVAAVFPMRFMNVPLAPIQPVAEGQLKPLASFLPAVRERVPGYPVTRVLFPERPDAPIRFVVYEGSRRDFFRASNLFFNPVSGALLRADLVSDRLAGDSIVHWIGAVHYGAFGSWPVKTLWVLGGIAFPLLGISGVILWLRKN